MIIVLFEGLAFFFNWRSVQHISLIAIQEAILTESVYVDVFIDDMLSNVISSIALAMMGGIFLTSVLMVKKTRNYNNKLFLMFGANIEELASGESLILLRGSGHLILAQFLKEVKTKQVDI